VTLKADMAADLTGLFLDTGEFAEDASYYPNGTAIGATTSFAVKAVPGDVTEAFLATVSGEADQRIAQFVASLAVLRAGMATVEGTARDPRRGDYLTVASGAYAGTWVVATFALDLGGGATLTCRYEQRNQIAGVGVIGQAGGG
jgi:hypothetical protein